MQIKSWTYEDKLGHEILGILYNSSENSLCCWVEKKT